MVMVYPCLSTHFHMCNFPSQWFWWDFIHPKDSQKWPGQQQVAAPNALVAFLDAFQNRQNMGNQLTMVPPRPRKKKEKNGGYEYHLNFQDLPELWTILKLYGCIFYTMYVHVFVLYTKCASKKVPWAAGPTGKSVEDFAPVTMAPFAILRITSRE